MRPSVAYFELSMAPIFVVADRCLCAVMTVALAGIGAADSQVHSLAEVVQHLAVLWGRDTQFPRWVRELLRQGWLEFQPAVDADSAAGALLRRCCLVGAGRFAAQRFRRIENTQSTKQGNLLRSQWLAFGLSLALFSHLSQQHTATQLACWSSRWSDSTCSWCVVHGFRPNALSCECL